MTKSKKIYVKIKGIKCEVRDSKRKATVIAYQNIIKNEYDNYISMNRMTESVKGYAEGLFRNIGTAPFVFGWLHWPEDENEKRILKGYPPLEVKKKPAKKTKKSAPKKPTATKKSTVLKKPATPKKPVISKKQDSTADKKPANTKKPVAKKKTTVKKQDSTTKKARTKKAVPKKK